MTWLVHQRLGKVVMEQGRDGIRKGQAGAPSTFRASTGQTCWHHLALLPFLLGIEEKALTGVTALGPHYQEEVVENKACTRLLVEGGVFE